MQYGRAGPTINLEKFFNLSHTTRIKPLQKQTYMQCAARQASASRPLLQRNERGEEGEKKRKEKVRSKEVS